MFRLIGLLAYVLVSLSVGMTSVAHAMEPQGGATVAATDVQLVAELGHTKGDSDEVPADTDTGYPHHHVSCHGEHIVAPFSCPSVVATSSLPMTIGLMRLIPLPSRPGDPALRPPQA